MALNLKTKFLQYRKEESVLHNNNNHNHGTLLANIRIRKHLLVAAVYFYRKFNIDRRFHIAINNSHGNLQQQRPNVHYYVAIRVLHARNMFHAPVDVDCRRLDAFRANNNPALHAVLVFQSVSFKKFVPVLYV